nr:hypothetical protein [Agromyces protaetiae]
MPDTSTYTVTIVRTTPSHAGSRGSAMAVHPATSSTATAANADWIVK